MRTLLSISILCFFQNFLPAQCSTCPLPFTQELLQAELPGFICAVGEDYANVPKRLSSNEDGLVIWETRTRVPGALDLFFAYDSIAHDTKGKELIAMYVCEEFNDSTSMIPMFEAFRQSLNMLQIDCVTLTEGELLLNTSEENLRAVTWTGEIDTPLYGLSTLKMELDLNYFGKDYFLVLHVKLLR